jgi:hypothetical protein
MEDFKQAQTQVQRCMGQLFHILALNDDGDPDRKRSASEEVTEDFVESLINWKSQATSSLHQLSQEMTQGLYSQMVDLQALEDLREMVVSTLVDRALRTSCVSFNYDESSE